MRLVGLTISGLLLLGMTSLYGLSDKVGLESTLTSIAQKTADVMYGAGNFIVKVDVTMSPSQYKVEYTEESDPKMSEEKEEKEVYLLPGIPALKNLSPEAMRQLPYNSITSSIPGEVQKIKVTAIVNKSVSRSESRKIEPLFEKVLGLSKDRDEIELIYKKFYYNPAAATQNVSVFSSGARLLSVQNIFYSLFLLLLASFVGLYFYVERRRLILKTEASGGDSNNAKSSPPPAAAPGGMIPLPVPNLSEKGSSSSGGGHSLPDGMKQYFSFISSNNIENLIYLIKKDNLKAEYLSIILSFLDENLCKTILSEYSVETQREVITLLINSRLVNPETLNRLENRYKTALECFVGGIDMLEKVLARMSNSEKVLLLEEIRHHEPKLYSKVRSKIILFEDLDLLDKESLQLVLSDIPLETLANALSSVGQALYQKFFDSLTQQGKEMLEQYLELKASDLGSGAIEQAQMQILNVVKYLDSNGRIDFTSKVIARSKES